MEIGEIIRLDYTGSPQEIQLEFGVYKIKCWGARGGPSDNQPGGYGGYTEGDLKILFPTILYGYVGGAGYWANKAYGGWNGGGNCFNQNSGASSGGGATDIRLIDGDWNDIQSLRSRIMVAAGGGGGARYTTRGGHGGGLTGTWAGNKSGYFGAQTSGAGFGTGGHGANTNYGKGGGGGGYYGGYAGAGDGYYNSGGGGSSFVSGLEGCNAIDEHGNHTGQPIHYSGLIFENPYTETGISSGNGYITIELIRYPDEEIRTNSNIYNNPEPEPVCEKQYLVPPGTITYQANHGLQVGDLVCTKDGVYQKPGEEDYNIIGMVSKVLDTDMFEYKIEGCVNTNRYSFNPGTLLYLYKGQITDQKHEILKPIGIQILPGKILMRIQQTINYE